MNARNFIIVGENIHCSRIVKSGGKKTVRSAGGEGVRFTCRGEKRVLSLPADWSRLSPAYDEGKIKHVAAAIHQALNGAADDRRDGEDYLCRLAERQIEADATYLDVNIDEYSPDVKQNGEIVAWLVSFLSSRLEVPLSIDSSNPEIIRIGLENCRTDIAPPMINSISLERPEVIDLAKQYNADAVVNAVGPEGIPPTTEGRLDNFSNVLALIEKAGIAHEKLHLDPLVLPISTGPDNGKVFLETTREARRRFEGVHLNGGLSNVSFGMPKRSLLNKVFIQLCVEAGTDGGIIDPVAISPGAVEKLDTESPSFKSAKAVLTGEDMFGMEYITAYREGRLK